MGYRRHLIALFHVVSASCTRSNTLGNLMKRLFWLGAVGFALSAMSAAQDQIFEWIRASDETAQLDPMDYHVGPFYRPAPDGGNMHIDIHSKLPWTGPLATKENWQATTQNPDIRPLRWGI